MVAPVCAPRPPKGDHKGSPLHHDATIIRAANQAVDTGSQAGQHATGGLTKKTSKLHTGQYPFNKQLMSGFRHNDLSPFKSLKFLAMRSDCEPCFGRILSIYYQ